MKAIIIDNESHIVEGLKMILDSFCPKVEVVATADSVKSGIASINKHRFDVLFLDIELDDGTGFDILKGAYNQSFKTVFITAYDSYALQAFQLSAVEYLLKPIDPEDLVLACEKVEEHMRKETHQLSIQTLIDNIGSSRLQDQKIVVADQQKIYALPLSEIFYLEADGAYTRFILAKQVVVTSKSLKSFEEALLARRFYRAHHSIIVNLQWVAQFEKQSNTLQLTNGMEIPVSHRKRDGLIQAIKALSI